MVRPAIWVQRGQPRRYALGERRQARPPRPADDRSQPTQPARGRRGRAGHRRARARGTGGTPRGHRGGVRLDRQRARYHRAAGEPGRSGHGTGQADRPARRAARPRPRLVGLPRADVAGARADGTARTGRSAPRRRLDRAPPISCSSPASPCPAPATGWAAAAAATTAPSPASPSAPRSGCCSTTTRSASTSPWSPTTARSPAPSPPRACTRSARWLREERSACQAKPAPRRTPRPLTVTGVSRRALARPPQPASTSAGSRVRVCSADSSTASRVKGHERVSPRAQRSVWSV